MEIITDSEPPPERNYAARLTDELKNIQPGSSFISDSDTVKAFRTYARNQGWDVRQKTLPSSMVQCWRVS